MATFTRDSLTGVEPLLEPIEGTNIDQLPSIDSEVTASEQLARTPERLEYINRSYLTSADHTILTRFGDKNENVMALQTALENEGYLRRPRSRNDPVGEFGDDTYVALIRFQRDSGLVVDGVGGPNTYSRLGIPNSNYSHSSGNFERASDVENSQQISANYNHYVGYGDTHTNVLAVQIALRNKGYVLPNGATGVFDASTDAAVRDFQRNERLFVDGIVGHQTYSKLGIERTPGT